MNQARPKTEVEAKVYDVLSHKNWGSSSTQMNDTADDSFDYEKFGVITKLMWEALKLLTRLVEPPLWIILLLTVFVGVFNLFRT